MEGTKIKIPVRKKARIEIIPLIDVIFFLLATFVLFTLSLNALKSLPVDLPAASTEKPKTEDTSVTIQVSGDGAIFWNRELIDLGEVPARIAHYKTQTDDPRILKRNGRTDGRHACRNQESYKNSRLIRRGWMSGR